MKAQDKVIAAIPHASAIQLANGQWVIEHTGVRLSGPQIHKSWAWAEAWRNWAARQRGEEPRK